MSMGMAHWTSRKRANTVLPRMAPSLAATRVTAIAVDLRWVGNNSTPEAEINMLKHLSRL